MDDPGPKGKKIRRITLIISVICLIAGLGIMFYPAIMGRINDQKNEQAISSMSSVYDRYGNNADVIEAELDGARRYNAKLSGEGFSGTVDDYEHQLDFDGNGIMGYIEIPSIDVKMLLYHGADDDVLAIGAGHLEGTSLPVGGRSTHAVITAHSGMKTMKAFDNLRKLAEGDRFAVTVLGRKLTYEVESIETVLPYETESLQIVKGRDMVTLVTCTPYGVNDHRLLVHGVRTEELLTGTEDTEMQEEDATGETEAAEAEKVQNDMETVRLVLILAVAVIAGAMLAVSVIVKKGKKR